MSEFDYIALIYGAIALVTMALDAAMCYVNKFKFKPLVGFIGAILWPIFLPIFIMFLIVKTEDFEG